MMCDCLNTVDQKLASMNTKVDWAWLINPKTGKTVERIHIATVKADKKKRQGPAILVCAYCPFCGEAFHEGGPCRSERAQRKPTTIDWRSMMSEFPHLMAKDALKLKETALQLRQFNPSAHIAVSTEALLSLIEQAHSPNLGMATTRLIREELDSRGPDSPDDYQTFNLAEATA